MSETVLLCGEGPTDYGKPGSSSGQWEEGPVQPLIRNSIRKEICFDYATKEDIRDLRLQRRRQKVEGKGKIAFKLCVIAKQRKIDRVILFSDADRDQSSKNNERNAKRRFERVYQEIREAFDFFPGRDTMELIPMVALKMMECWLLGDENAFEKCYGKKPVAPRLPKRPELIWGSKQDPESDYPKHFLRRVLAQYHKEPCRETFYDIAENADTETLRIRCAISFERFYGDIQELF